MTERRELYCGTRPVSIFAGVFREGDPGSQALLRELRKGLPRNGIHPTEAAVSNALENGCGATTLGYHATAVVGPTAVAAATDDRWRRTPILTTHLSDDAPTAADQHDRRTITPSMPSLSDRHRTVSHTYWTPSEQLSHYGTVSDRLTASAATSHRPPWTVQRSRSSRYVTAQSDQATSAPPHVHPISAPCDQSPHRRRQDTPTRTPPPPGRAVSHGRSRRSGWAWRNAPIRPLGR
jgi:hypothetical protein